MEIYHIEFAKTGLGLSGGETCMIENIKFFKSKGIQNILLTTDNGKKAYGKLGLIEDDFLKYKIINSYKSEKYHIFISYLTRTIKAIKLIKNMRINKEDVLFCHSGFFPNSIPFYFLAKKNKNTKLFYWLHMLAPDILKGYEGHFTGKFQIPRLNIIHYKLNQWLYKKLTFNRGVILTVNAYYKNILRKKYSKNKVYVIKKYGGIDIPGIRQEIKKYDLVWMGRFHPQKGLSELPKIIDLLKKRKNGTKILILGGSNKKITNNFLKEIKNRKLEENIDYKGFITGDGKFKYIKQAKIFLMTSFYESFGQVNLEAMKCSLPVVAYDLPVFDVFKKGMIKVDILDNKRMTDQILKLLNDDDYYSRIKEEAIDFSSEFSWRKTSEEIYNLVFDTQLI